MSLTSILDMPNVGRIFSQHVNVPKTKTLGPPKVLPKTTNYRLVGMAFDYLLRFFIVRNNLDRIKLIIVEQDRIKWTRVEYKWVAYQGVKFIKENYPEYYPIAQKMYEKAVEDFYTYVFSGVVTEELLESTLNLAYLEVVYRTGEIPPNFGEIDEKDIEDLRNLLSIVKPKLFTVRKYAILNPDFGLGSALVGGADADLIIDDVLIEIKTTTSGEVKPEYIYQLVGYYILSKIDPDHLNWEIRRFYPGEVDIKRVGIYFSRHGELVTFDVKDLVSDESIDFLVEFFKLGEWDLPPEAVKLLKIPLIGYRRAELLVKYGIDSVEKLASLNPSHPHYRKLSHHPAFRGVLGLLINFARAISSNKPIVIRKHPFFEDIEKKMDKIYFFDAEYIPRGPIFLIGIMDTKGQVYQEFLDNPEDEREMLKRFLEWFKAEQPILVAYSSTSADKPQLKGRLQSLGLPTRPLEYAFFDLFYDCIFTQKEKTQCIFLPITGSLGLKEVSEYFGYKPPENLSINDGAVALTKYQRYLRSNDAEEKRRIKQELLEYNKTDLERTKLAFEKLRELFEG